MAFRIAWAGGRHAASAQAPPLPSARDAGARLAATGLRQRAPGLSLRDGVDPRPETCGWAVGAPRGRRSFAKQRSWLLQPCSRASSHPSVTCQHAPAVPTSPRVRPVAGLSAGVLLAHPLNIDSHGGPARGDQDLDGHVSGGGERRQFGARCPGLRWPSCRPGMHGIKPKAISGMRYAHASSPGRRARRRRRSPPPPAAAACAHAAGRVAPRCSPAAVPEARTPHRQELH